MVKRGMLPSKTPATMILILLAACNGTPDPIGDGIGGDSSTTGETMLTGTGGSLSGTGILEESTGQPSSASTGQGGSGSGSDESTTGDSTGATLDETGGGCHLDDDNACRCTGVLAHPSLCGCEDVDNECVCDDGSFSGSCTDECFSMEFAPCTCPWGPGQPQFDCDCFVNDVDDCACDDHYFFPSNKCG